MSRRCSTARRRATKFARDSKSLVSLAVPGDTLVVQYSGHGSFVPDENGDEPDGTDECLCPADIGRGYITDDELFELFSAAANGVQIVLIADSCHSGTITRFAPITTPPTVAATHAPQRQVRFLPPAAFLDENAWRAWPETKFAAGERSGQARGADVVRMSGRRVQLRWFFLGRPNGVFSYVALEALKSLPETATYKQWHDAIRRKLPSRQYPQSPNLYGSAAMKNKAIFANR